ncbi:Uncharacterised protein [Achromobacter sp. 2789STDY5608633]|jgi:ABC-type dipeptide/oligopeptide/nickel transport system permease component|uniref:Uncharacterized protein n=1 Tax=Achromobacter insuavis TaxID=1287735 RepID=A0A6J4ZRJ2_9BURK|nr:MULTISPECIES: hypothetical protein [Achromobacter]CAB3627486.1 hypothetical protein LMG26845_00437 [Achromobacter insuavis]CUJ78674.1 Uncharacterised protein [Achromobacter sp. 2789STDY5608633]
MSHFNEMSLALVTSHPAIHDVSPVLLILLWIAASTWLVALMVGIVVGLWLLWHRRGLRKWIADFDLGLEREERIRAALQRRHRFRS